MPVVRWILSVTLALAFMTSATLAWASSGITGDDACCCPVKAKCKCHDHDGDGPGTPVMKRCAGNSQLVTPTLVVATAPEPVVEPTPPDRAVVRVETPEQIPDDWSLVPERPPF